MPITKNCLECGAKFQTQPNQIKRGFGRFCGKSCQVLNQHKTGTNKAARAKERHHNWKGGKAAGSKGYVLLRAEDHPGAYRHGKYRPEHILVCESILGRHLQKNEVVHHIDECRDNNSPANLSVMTRGAHTSLHKKIASLISSGEIHAANSLARSVQSVIDLAAAEQTNTQECL